ncbi:MAG: Bestrophin, RFP-TM, chloride channel-domain-containing protein [Monoraphidium minutum]|nr:MAG: Bestrophin, RFP-TM, chloride channel-domain-containing protein [Monoraphidium minutum]
MQTAASGMTQRRGAFAGARVPAQRAAVQARRAPRARAVTPLAMGREQLQDLGRPKAGATAADIAKEESRKYRRTVFNFDNWEGHRSVTRYNRHLIGMFTSRVVQGLSTPLMYMAGVSTAVVVYETLHKNGTLPDFLPSLQLASKEPFGLTSFALSLMLVFRTNTSYGRWDEARKMWGLVLNRSRDIVRLGLSYIPEERQDLRDMLVRWTPAFSRSLMCHLRKGEDLREELANILLPHEVDSVLMATHRPNYCLQVLSQVIKESGASTAATIKMDDNLTAFEDCLGGCERILKTPVPLSYTRHTSRFLIIWLTLLPFTLYGSCGAATVPLCCIIAFLLLGIEEIGVSIEEPFSILALQAICDSALGNTRELQAQHDLTKTQEGQFSAPELIMLAAAAAAPGPAAPARVAAVPVVAAASVAAASRDEDEAPAAEERVPVSAAVGNGTPTVKRFVGVWPANKISINKN